MCRRHGEGFCIAFSQAEDRQNFSVSFLPGACFVLVLHCRKLRQRQRKTNSETLRKGSAKTAGKAERDSFYRKNLFQCSGKCHGQYYGKLPWSLCHSQKIKYFVTLFSCAWGTLLPWGGWDVAECWHRDWSCWPAALGREHHCQAASSPSGSCSECICPLSSGK